jgi:PIN domain nuclease of toxin-antitoxin system
MWLRCRLSARARGLIGDPHNEPTFSTASLWEIVIKRGLGRGDFRADRRVLRRGLLENGWTELPVLGEHVLAVDALPPIHRDPFDRLLVAQATIEGMLLLTADPKLVDYPGPVRRV